MMNDWYSSKERFFWGIREVSCIGALRDIGAAGAVVLVAGTFLVGEMSKALVAEKGSIMVEVGLDGNDFTQNMRTILGEARLEVIIENNDLTAFVKGTFATTNAALETT